MLETGNVTEDVAARIAVAAGAHLATLGRAGCHDRPLLATLIGVLAHGLSRSGRADEVEAVPGVLWQVVQANGVLRRGNTARQLRPELARRVASVASPLARARLAACDLLFGVIGGNGAALAAPLATIRDGYDPSSAAASAADALLTEHGALAPEVLLERVEALIDLML